MISRGTTNASKDINPQESSPISFIKHNYNIRWQQLSHMRAKMFSQLMLPFQQKMQKVISGTNAAIYKLLEPHLIVLIHNSKPALIRKNGPRIWPVEERKKIFRLHQTSSSSSAIKCEAAENPAMPIPSMGLTNGEKMTRVLESS